ncbi:MAG: acylphosphatase [Candidatus Omnitrophota bacterium]
MAIKQANIFYTGRVQGVGFRYTVQRICAKYALAGWTRNLPDKRVEVLIQGLEEDIQAFVAELDEAMSGYIRGKQLYWQEKKEEFRDFQIRF